MERILKQISLTTLSFAFSLTAQALSLSDALMYVKKESPVIAQSLQGVESSKASLLQEKSKFIPDISLSGSYTSKTLDREGADAETHPRTLGLTARQSLFSGGDIVYGWRAAKMAVKAAEASYQSTMQNTLLETITAYVNLLTAKDVEALQQNQLMLLEEQLAATKARYDAGEVTTTDVSQARARVASTRASYVEAQGSVHVAQAVLDSLLGKSAEGLEWPEDGVSLSDTLNENLTIALESHPNIISALSSLTQARYAKIQAASDYFPEVDAVASHSYIDDDDTKGYRDNRVGLEVTWSLFNGGDTKGAVDAAIAAKVSAEQSYEEARRTVKENVTQAYYNHQTAKSVLDARVAEEKAAVLAEKGVEKENQLGERTVLDLLDARQELLEARVNKTRARADVLTTSYALLAAIGNLDVAEEVN